MVTENAARAAYTRSAVRALSHALVCEPDWPGWLAQVLASVAADAGGSSALTASRPGSWEADLVDRLVRGTVGYDDAFLPAPGSVS